MLVISPKMMSFSETGAVQELELTWAPDDAMRERAAAGNLRLLYRLRVNDKQTLTMSATHGVLSLATGASAKASIRMRCEEAAYLSRCIVLVQWFVGDSGLFSDMSGALVSKTFVAHSTEVKYGVVHCCQKNHSPTRPPRVRLDSLTNSGSSDFGSHNPSTPRVMTRATSEVEADAILSVSPIRQPEPTQIETVETKPLLHAPPSLQLNAEPVAHNATSTDDTDTRTKGEAVPLSQRLAGFLMAFATLYLLNKHRIPSCVQAMKP